jgi:hypothetical protein
VDGGAFDLPSRFGSWEECAAALEPPDVGITRRAVAARLRAAHPDWADEGIEATLANLEEQPDGTMRNRLPRGAHLALLRTMWDHPPSLDHPAVAAPTLFLLATGAARWPEGGSNPAVGDCTVERIAGDHDLHVQLPGLVAARIAGLALRP